MLNIGSLNEKIEILKLVKEQNEYGEEVEKSEVKKEVWARIRTARFYEANQAKQAGYQVRYEAIVRPCEVEVGDIVRRRNGEELEVVYIEDNGDHMMLFLSGGSID